MIIFTPTAYQKIKHFTLQAKGEISGLGQSEHINKRDILVKDIIILKQETTEGSTTLDEGAMAKFLSEKMKAEEDVASWNIWWHSHADMYSFWSATDDSTIETTTGGSHLFSIVINKRMSILARLDIFRPNKRTLKLKVIKPKGRPKLSEEYSLEEYCKKEIEKCITHKQMFPILGFGDRWQFSTQKKNKKRLPWWEQEILAQQRHTDYPNWD